MADLTRFVAGDVLATKPAEPERVRRWLARSRKDLRTAMDVLRPVDKERAMAVVYEAGLRACRGLVDLEGYRVLDRPGHHRTAIDAAAEILGGDWALRLRRLDSARRFRHETLYGDVPTASDAQLKRTAEDVAALVDELERRLPRTGRAARRR